MRLARRRLFFPRKWETMAVRELVLRAVSCLRISSAKFVRLIGPPRDDNQMHAEAA